MTLAVIAHDAGGAEIVSSYVRQQRLEPLYAVAGPALAIFQRKLGTLQVVAVEEAVARSQSILCATSWQSDLEVQAIRLARQLGRSSVAFLDHWVNYAERFERAGQHWLPDEIWVGDVIAQQIARQTFPSLPISLVENPYFTDIRAQLAAAPNARVAGSERVSVLYVCEPVRAHALMRFGNERHFGYVEEDALRYFLANIEVLGTAVERICIRPHPSETPGKYDWARQLTDVPIEIGGSCSLVEEVNASDVVVGCESMAMVVGLLAGKRTLSCVPPGGKRCGLPHEQIEHCQQILAARQSGGSTPAQLGRESNPDAEASS